MNKYPLRLWCTDNTAERSAILINNCNFLKWVPYQSKKYICTCNRKKIKSWRYLTALMSFVFLEMTSLLLDNGWKKTSNDPGRTLQKPKIKKKNLQTCERRNNLLKRPFEISRADKIVSSKVICHKDWQPDLNPLTHKTKCKEPYKLSLNLYICSVRSLIHTPMNTK